jgi:hypothetical protein
MRGVRSIAKMLLGGGIALLMSQAVLARDVTIGDIVGRWCGEHSNYTFSRTDMVVTPVGNWQLSHAPHWVIDKVAAAGRRIEVFWKPARAGNSTAFELSGDRRTLTQESQTEGDKGPRRIFHRC